jgi:hypothetical protein
MQDYASETNGQPCLEIEPGYLVTRIADGKTSGIYRSIATISWAYRVGVRDDGTLRIYAHQLLSTNSQHRYVSYEWSATDLQIGTGTNWLAVAGGDNKIVTLKNDGTLWLWNFHPHDLWSQDRSKLEMEIQNTVPIRLGTHSDWIAISSAGSPVTTLAADGSLWIWPLGNDVYWGQTGYGFFGSGTRNALLDISHKPQLFGNVFGKADPSPWKRSPNSRMSSSRRMRASAASTIWTAKTCRPNAPSRPSRRICCGCCSPASSTRS